MTGGAATMAGNKSGVAVKVQKDEQQVQLLYSYIR